MRLWLARTSGVLVVVVTALLWGNLEAAAAALLLATFARHHDGVLGERLKLALLSIWMGVFVLTSAVAVMAAGPQTPTRRNLVLGLYDLNCSAPFGTYRYPRDVRWLAEGNRFYSGKWSRVLVCEPWIK
jgi:hypothetical protein